ncbi:MAG TPA: hypothetical protein VNZ26_14950 [Vicinamibacterales bacterium]|nr:hypothetical protein [Vicinamibacterales bacterium]
MVAVIGGVALPFTLATPRLATTLSFGIAIAAALDTIYRPSDNWKTYPNAYDELFLAKAKYVGTYDQASEIYNTTNIERRLWKGQVKLERLVSEANDKVKRLGRHD